MATFSEPQRIERNGRLTKKFYVRVNDGGRRSWRTTGQLTKKLAKEVLETWRMRDAKGERHVEDMGFTDAAARWLATKESRASPGCARVYGVYVRHWGRHFKNAKLRSIESGHIENYFTKRQKKVSNRTLNNERAQLRSLFSFAVRKRWLVMNPALDVDKFPEMTREIRVPDDEQVEKLLDVCRKDDALYGFVLCLVEAGLRRGTTAALEWEDVDFGSGCWQIPATKMKSGVDFHGRPIAPRLLKYVKEHRRPAGQVFEPLDAKKFLSAARKAGMPWLRPHDLRRAFVTRCRRLGVPMEVAMRLSDHRDVRVVVDVYRAVEPDDLREAMRKLHGTA